MVTRLKGLLRIYQNTSSRLGPSFVSKSEFRKLDVYRSLCCSRTTTTTRTRRIDDTFEKGRNLTIALAAITTITYIDETKTNTKTKGTIFSSCEKKEDEDGQSFEKQQQKQQQQQQQPAIEEKGTKKDEAKSEEQPDVDVDVDVDEDEPTTCTICLINRQGPCRPYWRKFERCMKENSAKDDDDGDGNGDGDGNKEGKESSESSSMSEKCDVYMLPWIKCIQQFRNRYTSISNAYFQKEMIDKVEDTFEVDERVLLDIKDVSTIVEIGSDWKKVVAGNSSSDNDIEEQKDKHVNVDDVLVEGVARINLWDPEGERQVELAYIKDQDGLLLGYDQFSYLKKNSGDENENDNDNDNDDGDNSEPQSKGVIGKVGECNFHVNPETTKSIQIFALYRSTVEGSDIPKASVEGNSDIPKASVEEDSDIPKASVEDSDIQKASVEDNDIPNTEAPAEASTSNKVMFYSSLIPMDKVKVQDIVEVQVADDGDKGHSRETDESKTS
uniref:GCK domain-containing protein n=1 Tax=Chaetoceros debilis TaxID=122233 RepID=A0A7S3VDS3_9STRA